jgi:hypothetical protein
LIKRGSGALYEDPWSASAEIVEDSADRQALDEWREYAAAHAAIVRLDDEDRWGLAVQIAVGAESAPGGLNSTAAFDEFDQAVAELVAQNGEATTDELRAGRTLALVGSLITIVLGFVAAVAVARGIGARRKEYA